MKFLFHITRAKNLILMNLHNMDRPLSPHGGHSQNTIFSLATEAGQEIQHQGRTTRWKVVALDRRGSYLLRHHRLMPPWKQVEKL
jgi:hypothetical protein